MRIYDWNEIRETGDCAAYLRDELRIPQTGSPDSDGWQKFAYPPWRPDSDSGGFAACKHAYKDHAKGDSGSILDLSANAEFAGDIWKAQEKLGGYYNLKARIKAKKKSHVVAEYIYKDMEGNPIHKTVRFEPKDFVQFRFEAGEWKAGLGNIEPVLYRISDWQSKSWIVIAEGEKDCDNLWNIGIQATTNAMGAENWRESYNEYFIGKRVVIFPDNDEKGRKHAELVSWKLKDVAKEIRIVTLPGLVAKGDVSDFIQDKSPETAKEELKTLMAKAVPVAKFADPEMDKQNPKDATKAVAKFANKEAFRNYRYEEKETSTGRKMEKNPIHINELVKEVFDRFMNFPCRVGDLLFDHDRKNGEIRYLENPSELFAWMQEKSGQAVQWGKIEGAVSQEQLFNSIRANSRRYEMISGVPNWPRRDDVYYTHGELPEPSKDMKYFNEFCSFFCPATDVDAAMLRIFFASPLYYRPKCDRPLWIIDSVTGQGSGKSRLGEMIAMLYGGEDLEQGEPISIDAGQVQNEQTIEAVRRRLMSRTGRKKRIFMLDNVCGFFQSPALASMITQGSLSGIAPYGRGEETRPNDLTYLITSNSATVNKDLSARSFILMLTKPARETKSWERRVQEFIKAHRLQIISDIIGALVSGVSFKFEPVTRFRSWETEIMAPMCGTEEAYQSVIELNEKRKLESDGESEEAEMIRNTMLDNIQSLFLDPKSDIIFIANHVLRQWCRDTIPGFGGSTGKAIPHILKNWGKTKLIPELSDAVTRFPFNNPVHRGLVWNYPAVMRQGESSKIKMIIEESEK